MRGDQSCEREEDLSYHCYVGVYAVGREPDLGPCFLARDPYDAAQVESVVPPRRFHWVFALRCPNRLRKKAPGPPLYDLADC